MPPFLGRVRSHRETDMRKRQIHGRTDHQSAEGAGCRIVGGRAVSQVRHQRCDLLQVAITLWREEVSDARKLKALEDENRKLKKLLAETMLDASTLKEMLGKNF